MREITFREAVENAYKIIVAAEHGETILITKDGKPVVAIAPHTSNLQSKIERQAAFAALRESLAAKRATNFRVGSIAEVDQYDGGLT